MPSYVDPPFQSMSTSQALKRTQSIHGRPVKEEQKPKKRKVTEKLNRADQKALQRLTGDETYDIPVEEDVVKFSQTSPTWQELYDALLAVVKWWALERSKTAKKKRSAPRLPTAYNIYFKTMMKSPKIQALPHSERMAAVAAAWKKLPSKNKALLKAQAEAAAKK